MASILIKDCNAVFVHIPKTAGQSARNALDESDLDTVIRSTRPSMFRWTAAGWAQRQFGRDMWRTRRCFTFVRNPWDWTVSGWLHVTVNEPHYTDPPSFREFVLGNWKKNLR